MEVAVAIIPARGGSKRIPRKNIKRFCGKPIIGYSISAARESGLFDRIIVSTDDPEIASVAKELGAEVPFLRPAELADDHTGLMEVMKHAICWLKDNGAPPEWICCIYATAPFVQPRYLVEGFEKLKASGQSFAIPVTTFPFPIQRALRVGSDGLLEAIEPANNSIRSQDLEEAYHDAGQFCWGRAEAFVEQLHPYSSPSVPVLLPRHFVQDIDTMEDWVRAELMFRALPIQSGACDEPKSETLFS